MTEIFVTDRRTDRRKGRETDRQTDRKTHRGKTAYPFLVQSGGIKTLTTTNYKV